MRDLSLDFSTMDKRKINYNFLVSTSHYCQLHITTSIRVYWY
jgi:hypothetical protein